MDAFSRDHLAELVGVRCDVGLSLYLPTHRSGPDSRPVAAEDLIRWKNLLKEGDAQLRARGVSGRDVDAMLAPARALVEDTAFWQHQSDGLAAFAAPGFFRTFRLPLQVRELVVAGPGLHVKPLLPLLAGDGRFYILALSQNEVRLVEATRDSAGEVDPASAPKSLREALRFDDPEAQLQLHSAAPRLPGGRTAMFHGHGVATDDQKSRVLRFCQQVDRGLAPVLRGDAPLVLAAVESVAAIYRQANTYRHLLADGVPGSPEDLTAQELHARAWPVVEAWMRRERDAAAARYENALGSELAVDDPAAVVRAAADGRVEVLFVPLGVQRWGTFDERTREVREHAEPHTGDTDLLDDAAVRAVLSGGAVYAVPADEVPGGGEVAAVLRY